MKSLQNLFNIISNLIVFAVNLVIGFFLTPFIIDKIGLEANGFISLSNNLISYLSLITISISSMAGRFLIINYHKQNFIQANKFYSTLFYSSIIINLFILLIFSILIFNLQYFVSIPYNLTSDVKILITVLLLNFSMNNIFYNWSLAIFISNRLDQNAVRILIGQIIRLISLFIFLFFFNPTIISFGISTILSSFIIVFISYYQKNKLIPELKVKVSEFSFYHLKIMFFSGIWNTVIATGQILLSGFDLLFSNIFLNPYLMSVFALAKTLPGILFQFASTITTSFIPSLTVSSLNENKDLLRRDVFFSMNLSSIFILVPVSIFIVYGYNFYSLWIPDQDIELIYQLTIISIFGLTFQAGIQPLFNIFNVLDKVKIYSLIFLASGLLNLLIIVLLVGVFKQGLHSIAISSTIINLVRNLFIVLPLISYYIDIRLKLFYRHVIFNSFVTIVVLTLGFIFKNSFYISNWLSFFVNVSTFSIINLFINLLLFTSRSQKKFIIRRIFTYFKLI